MQVYLSTSQFRLDCFFFLEFMTWTYLCAASGSALRCERLALRGAGLSAGEELKMLSESSRGASGLVLKKRAGGTSTNHTDQREKSEN